MSSDAIRRAAVDAVKAINSAFPGNHDYHVTNQAEVGPFSIYTVEFSGHGTDTYTNFCLVRGSEVIRAAYFLSDLFPQLDRRLAWRALLIDQFALVSGVVLLTAMIAGAVIMQCLRHDIPQPIWIGMSSAIAFLLGMRGSSRSARQDTP